MEQDNSLSSTPSSVEGATPLNEPAPVAFNAQEYKPLVSRMFQARIKNPSLNLDTFRPADFKGTDEDWDSLTVNAEVEYQKARKNAFGEISTLVGSSKTLGYGWKDGVWSAKNLPSELKNAIASKVLIQFPNSYSSMAAFRQCWNANSVEELGEMIATNVGLQMQTKEERARAWSGLSESERISMAKSIQEQYNVKNPVVPSDGENARIIVDYYTEAGQKFYEASLSACADDEETKVSFALSLMSDGKRTETLKNIVNAKGIDVAARVAESAYALKAYHDGNIFGVFASSTLEGIKEGIGAVGTVFTESGDNPERDLFSAINKYYISQGKPAPTVEQIQNLSEREFAAMAEKIGLFSHKFLSYNELAHLGENDFEFTGVINSLKNTFAEGYNQFAGKFAEAKGKEVAGKKFTDGSWMRYADMAGRSLGYMGPIVASGFIPVVGPGAAIGIGFAQGYDEFVDEIYANGDVTMTNEEVALGGSLYGAFYAGTNFFGGKVATYGLDYVKGIVGRSAAKSVVDFNKRGVFQFVKDSINLDSKMFLAKWADGIAMRASAYAARALIREGSIAVGEGIQEASEDLARWAIAKSVSEYARDYKGKDYLQEKDIVDSMLESFKHGFILSGVQRGVFGGTREVLSGFGGTRSALNGEEILGGNNMFTATRDKLFSYVAYEQAFKASGEGFAERKGLFQLNKLANDFISGDEKARTELRNGDAYGNLTTEQKQRLETLAHVKDQLSKEGLFDFTEQVKYGRDVKGENGVRFTREESELAIKLFRAKSTLFNILARKSYYEQSLKESKSDADKKLTQASLETYALREDAVRKYIERASKELESLEGRSLKNSRLGSDSFSESKLLEGYKIASELGNDEAKAIAREIAEIYGVELGDSKPEGTAQPPTPAPEGTQGEPVENSDENKQVPETPLNSDEKSTNEEPVKISTPEPSYSDNEPQTSTDATEKASSEGVSAEELPIERLAEKYEEKFGNVLSTDNAKLLFDGYNPHDVKSIISFHAKAGAIISKLFDYFLNTKKNAGDGSVVYTAGGVGSGKSTVVNSFKKTADFVMDSTMAGNIAYTRDGINKVLNNGQKAVLVYVYRDAKDAWYNGVLKRAKTSTGHVVSRKTFTGTHTKAYKNFKKIVDEFGDKVEVKVFEVVDGVAPIQISLQDLETKRFYTEEELGDIYDGKIPDEARPEQNARADRPVDSGRTGDAVPSDLRDEGGNRGMESENAGDGTSSNADGQGAGIEDGSSAPDISGRRSSEPEPEGGTDKSAKANDSDNRELESSSPAREDSLPVADESGYDSVEPTQADKPSLSAEETKKRVSQLRQKVAEVVEREYPDVVSEIDIVIWAEDLGLKITPSQCKAILFDALFGKNKKAINDLRKNGERGKAFFKAITDSVYAISFVKAESDLDIVGNLVEAANYWNKLKTSTILHDEALSADGIELQNILLNFADGTPETLKIYIGALGALSTFRNEYKEKDSSWWDGTIKEDIPFVASAIGFYAKYPSEVNVADSVLVMIREIAKGDAESLIALRGYLAERSRVYDKTGTFDFDGSGASATVTSVVDKTSMVDATTESATSAPVNATQDAIAGAAEDLKRTEEPKKKRKSKEASNKPGSPEKRIESFGEEVIGNRDMWNSYRKTLSDITKEQLQAKTLSDVFPRPNAFGLVKSGNVSADVAALTLYIYNSIPPKPRYSEGYWLDSVLKASKIIQMLIEDKELAEKYLDNLRETAKKTETVGKFTVQTSDSIRAENTILYVDTLKALGFPEKNVKLGKKSITVSHYVNKDSDTRYSNYVIRNGNSRVKSFDSFEKAVDALRSMVDSGKGKTRVEAKIELKLFKDRVSKEIFIAVGNTSRYQKLKGGFKDWQTARAYIEENRASLEELYRRIKDIPSERNAENAERIGADWRKGKDVSEAQFAETFGFRGVRFGKWVEQDKRQEDLNDAFDALMDLADLLGVSPKALSLNGELALAFGALGHSDASAHYESGNKVINLTKKHGAGSLAHEWWHALDNYFGAMSGSGMSMITEARKLDEDNIRKEVAEVFFAVRDAIFNSKLAERSKALDGLSSGKPYWGTIVEMTARAFESWVKDTIDRDGRSNDYLANISSLDEWQQKRPKSDGVDFDDYPYPLPSEMESLGTLFRALADTIEERTGENGSVALYQMPTTEAMTISEADQRLLVKHVEGFVPGATVQVVDDVEAAAGEADKEARYQIAQEPASDEELASIEREAKSNGTWLKAPNGNPSKLNPRQWVQVRTQSFKKWFGDWEKAARIEKLKNSVPVEISGNEIAFGENVKENVKLANQYAKNFRGKYTNKDTGNTIPVFSGSLNELSQHDRGSKAHLQSFAAIPQIIENSIYITTLANEDLSKHPGIKEFEYYVCGMKIGGVDYTVKAVVAVERNGARYYDHKLTQIEKGALLSSLSDVTKSAGKAGTPLADIKDKRLLSILQADSSKVVDENGEPLVVYHGSRTGGHFYEFANNSFFSDDFDTADMFKREADFDLYVNGKVVGTVGDEDAEFLANELSDGDYTAKDIAGWGEIAREDISSDYVIDEVRRLSDYEVSEDEIETVRLVPTRGVFDVFLNIRNPLVVDYGGKVWMDNSFLPEDKIKEARKKKEHDGVVVKNIVEGGFTGEYRGGGEPRPSTDYIPFSPEQIKSATDNVGTFDASNTDIRYMKGDSGNIYGTYVPDTKQVFVAKNARVDTLLHELGWHATFHWAKSNAPELYKLMKRYASEAPAELKSKVAEVYGYKDGKISDAEFLDECGAALFSEQNRDLMESLLAQLQGRGVKVKSRNWWKKFVEAVKALWAKLVKSRSDEVAEQGNEYADIARILSDNYDNPAGAMRELAQAFADGKALRAGTVPSGNASPLRERFGHKRVLFQRADDGAKAAMLTVPRDGVWRKWRDKVSEIHSLKIVVREGIYNADMEKARLIYQRAKEAAAGKKVLKASTLTDDELKKNMKGLGIEKLGSAAWGIEGWSKKVHDKLKKHFEGKEGVGDDYILELWKTIVVPSFDMAALKTLSKENVAVLAKLTEAIENAKSFDEALKLAEDAESKLKNRAEEGLINEHRDQLLKLIGKYKGRWDKHQTKLNSQRKTEGLSEYYLHALATLNGYLESGDTESLERDIKNAEASLDSAASDEAKLQANMFLSAASDLGNTPISDMGDEQVMSLLDKAETLFTDGVATLEAAKKEREEAVEASFGAIIKAIYKAYKKESGKVEKKSIRNYFRLGYSIRDKFDVLISSAPPEFRAAAYMAAQDLALRMTHCETKQGAILADDASAFIEAFAEQFGEGKDKELLGRVLRRGKGRGMAEWRIERKYLIPILMEKRDGSEDFSRYGKKLTNAQLLYQYLAISQREHDHLFKRATEEDIKGFDDEKKALYNRWKNKEALKEFLGEKLVAFGDKLVEIMESHAEAIDKQSVRDTGLPLSYKRKGYFPIVRNLEKYMTDVAIQGKSPIIPKVLIPRTHSSYDIDEEADVISVFRRHSFDVAHYITHGELNQELRLILESDSFKDFRKHIAAVGGEAFSEDFAKHLQDVISGRMAGAEYYNPSAKVMDKAVRLGRWIARVCALGLNVISGLKQVLGGMASFANDYGFINLLKAVMSNSQDMMANWEEIYESDGYQTRYPGMSLGRAMNTARLMNNDFVGNKLGRVLMWGVQVEQSLMFMTANGDKVPLFLVGSSLYGALKEYYYGKGNITREEAKARAMADFWERVDRCQQARMVHNTDTISRGSNELKKAFVQFLTAPLQFASAEIKAVEMVANTDGSKDAWNQLANVATHNHIVEPGLMLLASLVAYSLSDDDEFDWERNMQPFIFGSMDSIPLIGGAAEFLVSDQYKTSAWSTAAFDFPTNIMRRSKAAVKTLWDGEEDTTRPAINKVFRTVTIIRQVEDIYGKIAEEE